MRLETDILKPALEAAAASPHRHSCPAADESTAVNPICSCHVGKARLALSYYLDNGIIHGPNAAELSEVMGANWLIGRRTERIVRQYGEDVKCVTPKQYELAELQAVMLRAKRLRVYMAMGVRPDRLIWSLA